MGIRTHHLRRHLLRLGWFGYGLVAVAIAALVVRPIKHELGSDPMLWLAAGLFAALLGMWLAFGVAIPFLLVIGILDGVTRGRDRSELAAAKLGCLNCGHPTLRWGRCLECGTLMHDRREWARLPKAPRASIERRDPKVARDKRATRVEAKALVAGVAPSEIERQSMALCKHLLNAPFMLTARTLVVYAPLKDEIDIRPLAAAWALIATREREKGEVNPRRLCVPRMNWQDRSMEAVEVTDWDSDLVLARLGLREPQAHLPVVPIEEIDVVIVPGLAFDRAGRRLGRGAGFYDRFLARLPATAVTVGVALREQVLAEVPYEPHDAKVQWLATAEGLEGVGRMS